MSYNLHWIEEVCPSLAPLEGLKQEIKIIKNYYINNKCLEDIILVLIIYVMVNEIYTGQQKTWSREKIIHVFIGSIPLKAFIMKCNIEMLTINKCYECCNAKLNL
jgi:hypothetical protein